MNVGIIADDLSGAAELAAAAADMGYVSEVHTSFDPSSSADVVAVDTDTRSSPAPLAAAATSAVTRQLLRAGVGWLYKKTDSVLRGNVRCEVESVMEAAGMRRALLVPANPSRGRTIRGGVCLVNGTPLAETAFAEDPEHPRRHSGVRDLLGEGRVPVICGTFADHPEEAAIAVPDVDDASDLRRHADDLDDRMLAAGGVEFFRAVLDVRRGPRAAGVSTRPAELRRPALLVCGSARAWGDGRAAACQGCGIPVLIMPETIRSASSPPAGSIDDWADHVVRSVVECGSAMVAIGGEADGTGAPSTVMAERLARAVARVTAATPIATFCVEGGATAGAVLRAVGWRRLRPLSSPDLPGVAALRPAALSETIVLVKPGSYAWPQHLWREFAKVVR